MEVDPSAPNGYPGSIDANGQPWTAEAQMAAYEEQDEIDGVFGHSRDEEHSQPVLLLVRNLVH